MFQQFINYNLLCEKYHKKGMKMLIDIEILERYLKFKEEYKESVEINEIEIIAFKSVLDKNKKLKKENDELKKITQAWDSIMQDSNCETKILIADSRYFDSGFFIEKFVTKEKIKGKIEELRKKESLFSANKQGYNLAMVQYQIQVLQELL